MTENERLAEKNAKTAIVSMHKELSRNPDYQLLVAVLSDYLCDRKPAPAIRFLSELHKDNMIPESYVKRLPFLKPSKKLHIKVYVVSKKVEDSIIITPIVEKPNNGKEVESILSWISEMEAAPIYLKTVSEVSDTIVLQPIQVLSFKPIGEMTIEGTFSLETLSPTLDSIIPEVATFHSVPSPSTAAKLGLAFRLLCDAFYKADVPIT